MILPFSTTIDGKETLFVEKILKGLIESYTESDEPKMANLVKLIKHINTVSDFLKYKTIGDYLAIVSIQNPKLHTIRLDVTNRWKRENNIDFFINCRQKEMFRFAPVHPVISTQRIFMTYDNGLEISINGRQLSNLEIETLAKNDGFDNVNDFDDYFEKRICENTDRQFSGKIIHWTDLKY